MRLQSDIKVYGRIIKLSYNILFVGKVSNGSLSHEISTWPLNCPSLRFGQFEGQKCLANVEISLKNTAKKNNIPHFLYRPYINSYNLS